MATVDQTDGHVDIDWQPVDHYPAATREKMARRTTEPGSYETYYGLAEPPFSLSPTVRFAFRSGSYATAFDQLRRALERREGFVVITGEVGTGKSMLCRAAMQDSGADVDAALANLPGGNGALQALAHMASPAEAAVSGWHMAGHGASSAAHDMIMKMDVSANHHDAVQPVANG